MRWRLLLAALIALFAAAAALATTAPRPRLLAASTNGTTVSLSFDRTLGPGRFQPDSWTVKQNALPIPVKRMTVRGKTVTLSLGAHAWSDDSLTVSYAGVELRSTRGQTAKTFDDRPVLNHAAAGCSVLLHTYDPAQITLPPDEHMPSLGTRRAVMLFVDFPNAQAALPTSTYDAIPAAITAWYRDTSYGKFTLPIDTTPTWVRMPQPTSAYAWTRLGDQSGYIDFIRDAIAAADPQVDFSNYQLVYVVPTPNASVPVGDAAIFTREQPLAQADGSAIYWGAVEPATRQDTAWLFVHETGHFLGLPDLYVENGNYADLETVYGFAGSWDIMSDTDLAAGFLGWQRRSLDWLNPSQVRCLTSSPLETDLTPLDDSGGTKLAIAQLSYAKALVVEQRQPGGFDQHLCHGGILIYTVDELTQSLQGPIRIHPAAPDDPNMIQSCGYQSNAAYTTGMSYQDPSGIRVDILGQTGNSYRIRLSRS